MFQMDNFDPTLSHPYIDVRKVKIKWTFFVSTRTFFETFWTFLDIFGHLLKMRIFIPQVPHEIELLILDYYWSHRTYNQLLKCHVMLSIKKYFSNVKSYYNLFHGYFIEFRS